MTDPAGVRMAVSVHCNGWHGDGVWRKTCLLAVTAKTRLIDLCIFPKAEHLNIHVNHQPSSMCVCALPMCHLIIRPQMCGHVAMTLSVSLQSYLFNMQAAWSYWWNGNFKKWKHLLTKLKKWKKTGWKLIRSPCCDGRTEPLTSPI